MLLTRALLSFVVTALLMILVIAQMSAANQVRWLTVEQLAKFGEWGSRGRQGLTFDRHYAMPIDFCIIAPFVGLVIFLCMSQWVLKSVGIAAAMSGLITIGLVVLWYKLPGKEAHNQALGVAIYHGIFLFVGLWAILMVDVFTLEPEPVLLLVMCIILPAFLFVGTHMYLGLLNYTGAASSFGGHPLSDPRGWSILIVVTVAQCWRTYMLIPLDFWDSIH